MSLSLPSTVTTATVSGTRCLHTLHLYGAAAVAAFGWAVCRLLDWDATPWLPLWFCGALLIYNVDRLHPDPADAVNIPERTSASLSLRHASTIVVLVSAATLLLLPILRGDWMTLSLVIGGAIVCFSYSIPFLGFRLKEVPILKTFMAPTVVALAILVPPWLDEGAPADRAHFAIVAVRAYGLLLFNMILCDLRDIEGDRRTGITSLPVALGPRRTRALLLGLLITVELLALSLVAFIPSAHLVAWSILCVTIPLYLGALIFAVRTRRHERFYEWWVEGMFFLPALAVLAQSALT